MGDAWQVLKQAGLPDGAARRQPATLPPCDQVQEALEITEKQASTLETRQCELLYAWLQAGFHHWPEHFSRIVGRAGADCRDRFARTTQHEVDRGRYLKLRRIAVENLSTAL